MATRDIKANLIVKDKGSKVVKGFSKTTVAAFAKIAGPLAIGAAILKMGSLMMETVKLGDKFDKLNKKLGISVETLSKLEHIANLSGVSFTLVTGSVERMQRRIGLATRGLGAANKAFEKLNIDVDALSKLNTEEQFLQLAETVMKVENPTLRAGYAFEFFGMTAAELQKMLPGLRKKLSETAASITTQQARDFAKYTDNMTEMKKNLDTIKYSVFGKIAEGMNQVFEASTRERNATLAETSARITEIGNSLFTLIEQVDDVESRKKGASYAGFKPGDNKDLKLTRIITTTTTGDKTPYESEFEKNKDALRAMYDMEQQMKDDHLLALAQKDSTAWMDNLANENEYKQKRIDLLQSIADKEKEIAEESTRAAAEAMQKKMQATAQMFSNLSNLMSQFTAMNTMFSKDGEKQSRSDFKRQKAFGITSTTISTAEAVANALAVKPWTYMNAVNAITAGMLGTIQTATIAKQEYAYAKGGVFTNSIVSKPTSFQQGLMGEAGPEAIMPLTKTSSGELGVKTDGGGKETTQVTYVIQAIDSKSFVDTVRRNPAAITMVMNEQMQRGNSALNNTIRRVVR